VIRSDTGLVDVVSPRLQAARRFWNEGQQADALVLFDESVRREPDNVQAYIGAARAYADKFDFPRMDHVLAKLLGRAPQHPGVHHYIAETYALLKQPERAIAAYETAAQLPGAGPPTWMELASLYERAHRLDEAEELIERTVRSGYDPPLVPLVRGRIQRRQNRPAEAEATLRTLIARIPTDSKWACQAWGELALMKDREGDYDGAVAAIESCKQAQGSHDRWHWEASDKVIECAQAVIANITRDDFHRWQDDAAAFAPARTALLTGFPRSGTTLLEQVLDAHPDLVSSEEREFVGKELFLLLAAARGAAPLLETLRELPSEQIQTQRQRYFQAMEYLLGEPIGARMHLDKNPAYNLTIPILLRYFPLTRLIVALRDPRDVVLSCYLRYLPLNAVSVRFLDVTRTAEYYATCMGAWLKLREQIVVPWCEIRYEDTVNDVARQARRALETLGLPWNDQVLAYRQRLVDTKRVNSPSYEAVAEPIYTRAIGRWKNYERLLEPALPALDPFIRAFGYSQ
jgi:tetratricopeptide (TPR) repeat protein